MALVWEAFNGEDHYQVRNAGQSIRLYKNLVFHSQWNETRPLSGGVWDLLFIPSLFAEENSIKRVLVLGVGGGAVIRQYTTLLASVDEVVGVELDPMHLQIAREYFGLDRPSVKLIEADAIQWVRDYRGPKFDVVIEDLFTESEGEPVRIAAADKSWFQSLRKLMRPGGTLIINFEDTAQLRASGSAYLQALPGEFVDSRYAFSLPTYGNCVGAFLATEVDPKALRVKLGTLLANYPASQAAAQKFRIRRILAK